MNLTAAALRLLLDKGLSLEDVTELVEVMEASAKPTAVRSKAAERMARYRAHRVESGMSPSFDGSQFVPALVDRDGPQCVYCETAEGAVVDHMHPVSGGGTDALDNLALACAACNCGKAGRLLSDDGAEIKSFTARAAFVRYVREHVRANKVREPVRSHVGEPAQVVTPSLPSLRSEELTSEPNGSSVNASKPADPEKPKTKPPKSQRGTRLPDEWEPSEADVETARAEGLTDEEISRAALEFRNYWCSRTRDASKLSWPRTWHNRCIDIADRKRRDGARMAARPGHPGGGGRGVEDFASIVARRRGYG